MKYIICFTFNKPTIKQHLAFIQRLLLITNSRKPEISQANKFAINFHGFYIQTYQNLYFKSIANVVTRLFLTLFGQYNVSFLVVVWASSWPRCMQLVHSLSGLVAFRHTVMSFFSRLKRKVSRYYSKKYIKDQL